MCCHAELDSYRYTHIISIHSASYGKHQFKHSWSYWSPQLYVQHLFSKLYSWTVYWSWCNATVNNHQTTTKGSFSTQIHPCSSSHKQPRHPNRRPNTAPLVGLHSDGVSIVAPGLPLKNRKITNRIPRRLTKALGQSKEEANVHIRDHSTQNNGGMQQLSFPLITKHCQAVNFQYGTYH